MLYEPKNFEHLLGTPGFSETLLKNHFTLYQGYVANANKLLEEITALGRDSKMSAPAFAEMKRRFGWEWNGMRLHEFYFGNLIKTPAGIDEKLHGKLAENFGSFEHWEKDFKAVGAMRGIGWCILYLDPSSGKMFNAWISEHDGGHLAGAKPLLILDVFEHAFMTDYGLKRAEYIEAFFKAIDWTAVLKRI